jgi:hypothetical protein
MVALPARDNRGFVLRSSRREVRDCCLRIKLTARNERVDTTHFGNGSGCH